MYMENLHVAPKKEKLLFMIQEGFIYVTSGRVGKVKEKGKSISSHELTKQGHSRSSKQGNSRSFKRILFFCLLT